MIAAGATMIGMPATGKSTYLAALYQALSAPQANAPRLARQPETRAYLEEIRQAWLRGEPLGRTLADSGELVELDVELPDRPGPVRLAVPDVAGETFENIVVKRRADAAATGLVQDADGLLLFTHPDHQRPRVPIAALKEMQALVGDDAAPQPRGDRYTPFDPRELPGEVHLVELLQWAVRVRVAAGRVEPTRVALMISAWDRAGDRPPDGWLAAKMPMLAAFLGAQHDRLAVRAYGVCAQGGDYGTEPVAERRPRDRAYALLPDGSRSDDLTAPLRWAALG